MSINDREGPFVIFSTNELPIVGSFTTEQDQFFEKWM